MGAIQVRTRARPLSDGDVRVGAILLFALLSAGQATEVLAV